MFIQGIDTFLFPVCQNKSKNRVKEPDFIDLAIDFILRLGPTMIDSD